MDLRRERDVEKAEANRVKHGVSFDRDVASVFTTASEANEALRPLARIIGARRTQKGKERRAHDPPLQPTGSAHG